MDFSVIILPNRRIEFIDLKIFEIEKRFSGDLNPNYTSSTNWRPRSFGPI